MVIQIRVTGMAEVQSFLNKLPKNLQTEIRDIGIPRLTESLQKMIKLRYSQKYGQGPSSTGWGYRGITRKKTEKGAMIEIITPYLVLIEAGVKSHYVSPATISEHRRHPGSTMFQKKTSNYGGRPTWWTQKGPFIKPALEKFHATILPNALIRITNKAIKNSGGKR